MIVVLLLLVPVLSAQAAGDYRQVVDLTFPVGGKVSYGDSYDAGRSGGRVHMAADIMAPEGAPIYAAVGGTVTTITGLTEKLPGYGYMIRVTGDDDRTYVYLHMGRNNGSARDAYVPGIAKGSRVERGQKIAYVGCSGNASCSATHLHFEIHDGTVTDPYKGNRINPHPSLVAAEKQGDHGKAVAYPFGDVARSVHLEAILALSAEGVIEGCEPRRFCPSEAIVRTEMAQVMQRALDVPHTEEDFFADDDGLDAEPAINALAAAGVVNGCGDGTDYCPDETVSRARLASYLARGFDLPAVEQDVFSDDDDHGHEQNINRLAASGITEGCTATRFCVTGKARRGQLASFLLRGLAR
jgi:hypothetical protein